MKIRSDFSKRAVVCPGEEAFVASPQPGVERLMLDRIGEEIARATSLVRFAPGSFFPFHEHGGGEEVFVLDGTFADEHGRYPAGTYLRDPIGTSHTPFTKDGCTLFVKLWQFLPGDATREVINTTCGSYELTSTEGLEIQHLHAFGGVATSLQKLAPGFAAKHRLHGDGEEILVLDGSFGDSFGDYPKGSWLRDPGGTQAEIASEKGCTLLVTTGHLARIVVPA
jgi:anti-sigma factor ChrR (cupin superfamily)